MKAHLSLLLVLLVAACAGSARTEVDAAVDAAAEALEATLDALPEADAPSPQEIAGDVGSETGPDPSVPILERAPALSHACAEALPPTKPLDADWYPTGLALDGQGQAWALRAGEKLSLSTLAADGKVGTPIEVPAEPYTVQSGSLAVSGDRFSLVWVEGTPQGQQQLKFALVQGGALQVAPKALVGTTTVTVGTPDSVALAAGGTTLAWMDADGSSTTRVRFARVDDGGDFKVGPVEVSSFTQAYGSSGLALARSAAGWALAWTRPDPMGRGEVWFARVDDAGQPLLEPRRVSREAGEGWSSRVMGWRTGSTPMLEAGSRTWLAYTESFFNDDYANPQGWNSVQLALIDAAGEVVVHPLQQAVDGVTATDPTLFELDGRLGLMWSQGTIIYICGGCFADNDLKLVLLDPQAIAAASEVASHTHAEHGYVTPMAVVQGQDLLSLSSQDFHALSSPAISVMRCTPTR